MKHEGQRRVRPNVFLLGARRLSSMINHNLQCEIISPGAGKGKLCFINVDFHSITGQEHKSQKEMKTEISRFEKVCDIVISELREETNRLKKSSHNNEAAIMQTHVYILEDHGFRRRICNKILKNGVSAELAIEEVLGEIIIVFEESKSRIFSERAADIKDIGLRLKNKLSGKSRNFSIRRENTVIAAKELFPSLVIEAKSHGVSAFIVENGTVFSHAAILAKAFGIPVLRIDNLYKMGLKRNQAVLVDAMRARLVLDPSENDYKDLNENPVHKHTANKKSLPVKLSVNIVEPEEVQTSDLKGLNGIGLYRTEFLFMKMRDDFPDEEEQFSVYASLFRKCKKHPVTIRTLDIGGDKTLPYFSLGPQENPFLGLRAHRIYRFHPEIFITQMRAILRAGLYIDELRILYPMIESLDELVFIQNLLDEAKHSLRREGVKFKEDFLQGIMIEVPAAVWNLKTLLNYVDFASVGTNDLLQYFFAADRNNANVYGSYYAENPVIIQVFKWIVDTGRDCNKPISICGELAADIYFLPLIIGLGFKHLSVNMNNLQDVKEKLLSLDINNCRTLTQKCLKASTIEEVHTRMHQFNFSVRDGSSANVRKRGGFIDPVCNMVVHTRDNDLFINYKGEKIFFCSVYCKKNFMKQIKSRGKRRQA